MPALERQSFRQAVLLGALLPLLLPAASAVPENDRDALIWIYEEWLGIDRWIETMGKRADG